MLFCNTERCKENDKEFCTDYWENNNGMIATPVFRTEYNLFSSTPQNVDSDIYIDRGINAAFEKHIKLQEVHTLEALENYGNGYFKINDTPGPGAYESFSEFGIYGKKNKKKKKIRIRKNKSAQDVREGFNDNNEWMCKNVNLTSAGSNFDVYHYDEFIGHFDLPLYGSHMVLNSLGAIGILRHHNIDVKDIEELNKVIAVMQNVESVIDIERN